MMRSSRGRGTGRGTAGEDRLIVSYVHLASLPRANEALEMLRRIASMVKPLMRARSWKVRELGEFWPDDKSLLGIQPLPL